MELDLSYPIEEFDESDVLILDDDATIRVLYAAMLSKLGFKWHLSSTINEAREIVDSENIGYAIVDYSLLGEIGLQIKEFFEPSKCVLISGYLSPEIIKEANNSGFYTILAKGTSLKELNKVLSKLYWNNPLNVSRLLDEIPELLIRYDQNRTIIFVNSQISYFNKTKEEVIGANILDLIHEDSKEAFKEHLESTTVTCVKLKNNKGVLDEWCTRFINKKKMVGYLSTVRQLNQL